MGKKQITEAISPMLFHRKNFTLLCLLAGSSRLAFFHSWLPMMTRIRSMTSAPMSQYIFCSSLMYHIPLSIRMAPTSAARASTHRMTAATRLPVALFLLAAVTTAGRLPVLPVEASTNSRSTFFFSAKLGHSFSISITKIGRNADFIVPSMRQMRKAFFVEKGQPPEAAPAVRIILLRGAAAAQPPEPPRWPKPRPPPRSPAERRWPGWAGWLPPPWDG